MQLSAFVVAHFDKGEINFDTFLVRVTQLNELEIKDGRRLRVNLSAPNLRLFVGNIPKYKDKSEIMQEASKVTGELCKFILCYSFSLFFCFKFIFLL